MSEGRRTKQQAQDETEIRSEPHHLQLQPLLWRQPPLPSRSGPVSESELRTIITTSPDLTLPAYHNPNWKSRPIYVESFLVLFFNGQTLDTAVHYKSPKNNCLKLVCSMARCDEGLLSAVYDISGGNLICSTAQHFLISNLSCRPWIERNAHNGIGEIPFLDWKPDANKSLTWWYWIWRMSGDGEIFPLCNNVTLTDSSQSHIINNIW